ncbi:MAG: radical SAM protein [Candidatus Aenigmarchaeota archaeon]|nr:radical SAM protein [Candidatus Aenigmarchaeota archaeon]
MNFNLDCAVWETTLNCNLNCLHCGSKAGYKRRSELNTKEALKLCKDLAELNCFNVCLMGGEPFLRKDWLKIAKEVKNLGMELSLVSNGLILDKFLNDLIELEPYVVGVSIDGTSKTHNKIRGLNNSFEKAFESLTLMRENDIEATAITTVHKLNFKDLPALLDLFLGRGLGWQIQLAIPIGRFNKKYLLSEEEFYSVALFMTSSRIKHFGEISIAGGHCFGYNSRFLPNAKWNGCQAGINVIGIESNGDITGCLSMGGGFVEDNIRNKSLIDIWNDENAFSYNRNFDKNKLGENCKDCKYWARCKGGCNATSYSLTSKFHNDPYCFFKIENNFLQKGSLLDKLLLKISK